MLPNLPAIETHAGRIAIGATVRSTRYRDVQGLVTAIYWNGYGYAIKVNDRHSDDAGQYELLSGPTHQGFNYVNPNTQQVLSGKIEVLLLGEGDRIYFADTAEQAIALLAATIGQHDQAREVEYLKQRAEAGPVDELRWRGQAVGSLVGQLACVSTGTGKQHPAPKFLVGAQVHFFSPHTTHTVSGLALYKDRLNRYIQHQPVLRVWSKIAFETDASFCGATEEVPLAYRSYLLSLMARATSKGSGS
ncbi:hypothetical protein [Hymenobacter glacieicola]|uniref:Uncharacterized protein n=1 Tax=Hymenobacter glacieicola TaxID=1562124 RepID=A0ABQ1X7P9_9BACT|nr:hypothetical protein [Hymenobacter glacieicola]GGG59906.1 hypothetical protein GCM10011378_39870 [Hymenobacter glacieicola]